MMVHRSRQEVRTLVVHSGGIGDFLLFCPALKRLAEAGPVDLAGPYRDRLNLAVAAGIARTVHHLDDTDFASVFTTPTEAFDRFVQRYNRVVVWMNDADGTILRALKRAGVASPLVFPGLPPEDWKRHASAYYGVCVGEHDLAPLVLPLDADDLEHDVLIHAGSGGARKNWPLENFIAIAEKLTMAGRTVEWIRGPAEETLRLPASARVLEVPSVITLARHFWGAHQYLGNDSGVTHLAAACNCATLAIFGPTDPSVWAPRGKHVHVATGTPWPSVEEVGALLLG